MSRFFRGLVGGTAALLALCAAPEAQAIEPMSPQQIVDLSKFSVGYSYWWGHGRFRTDGAQHGSCSGSCPGCSHTGSYGGDCSGLVAKVWQIPGPTALDDDEHPYSTYNFDNQTTHWTNIDKGSAALADAFVYNTDGAGHIFLFEGGDPWGYVNAYECKGCSYGCVYGSRKADSKYKAIRRNALTGGCKAHCEGSKIIGDDCGQGDCGVYGATCVDDALGVRCVFGACPAVGAVDVCLDDKTIGNCKDGQITTGDCSAFAAFCSTAGGQPAHCASAFCVGSPKDVPFAHDICFIDGKRMHCDASGQPTDKPCEAGSQCSTYPEVQCVPNLGCPATGKGAKICLDAYVMGECYEGAANSSSSCAEIDSYCSTALGEPRCIPTVCVSGPGDKPTDKVVCGVDGQVAHCKADGSVEYTTCPAGSACSGGTCVAGAAGGSQAAGGGAQAGGGPAGAGGKVAAGGSSAGGSSAGGKAGAGAKGKAEEPTVVSLTSEETETGGCGVASGGAGKGGLLALALAALVASARRRRG